MNSAAEAFFNDDLFFDQVFEEDNISLYIEFQILDGDDGVDLSVTLNDQLIAGNKYFCGTYLINEVAKAKNEKNTLHISITDNKQTTVKLKKIVINNYDLIQDYDLYRSQMKFINLDTAQAENIVDTFAFNASYQLEFTSPFTTWYQENTNKNVVIAESMAFCATDQDLEYYQLAVDKVKKLIV